VELKNTIKPSSQMDALGPYLPKKYSPLTPSGSGLQSVYLTHVPPGLADALISLIGSEATQARRSADSWASDVVPTDSPALEQARWEEDLALQIQADPRIAVTTMPQIILARRGQGKFRERVSRIEHACRITGVNRPEHLIASHCKPWRDCESNDERLDGENGLLLTPTVDHLFDRELLISPVVHRESLRRMGISPEERRNVGGFTEGQRRYLEFHREAVFLEARVKT